MKRPVLVTVAAALAAAAGLLAPPAASAGSSLAGPVVPPPKVPVMTGGGGSRRLGGRGGLPGRDRRPAARWQRCGRGRCDAATLGVTEPFSSGIGGGGFLVYYDATAPHRPDHRRPGSRSRTFNSPRSPMRGQRPGLQHRGQLGAVGRRAGHAGAVGEAARRWGTQSAARRPCGRRSDRPPRLHRRRHLPPAGATTTRGSPSSPRPPRLYLKGGQPPAVGSVFRTPTWPALTAAAPAQGVDALYRGRSGATLVRTARNRRAAGAGAQVCPGQLTADDLADYRAAAPGAHPDDVPRAGRLRHARPSSGGTAVGEALNILEAYDRRTGSRTSTTSSTCTASRGDRDGLRRPQPLDRRRSGVPTGQLLRRDSPTSGPATVPLDPAHPSAALRQPGRLVLVLGTTGGRRGAGRPRDDAPTSRTAGATSPRTP